MFKLINMDAMTCRNYANNQLYKRRQQGQTHREVKGHNSLLTTISTIYKKVLESRVGLVQKVKVS